MKHLSVFWMLALSACAGSSGHRIDNAELASLRPGVTTYDQVVSRLGQPNVIARDPTGTTIAYTFVQFSPFSGAALQSTHIRFDEHGVFESIPMESSAHSN